MSADAERIGEAPACASAELVVVATPGALTPPRTLAEAVPGFLGWFKAARQRADNTIRAYRASLGVFTEFCGRAGLQLPEQITFKEVELYLAWLQHRRGATPQTANRHRAALEALWVYLIRQGLADRNPVRDTFYLKTPKRLPDYLTTHEMTRVLEVLARKRSPKGRRNLALVATGMLAGLRCGELARLEVGKVDLTAARLRVVGKGDKERELPILPPLATILRPYLTDVRPRLLNGHAPPPWLFVKTGGRSGSGRLSGHAIWYVVDRSVSPIVGRHVRPHVLRHTFGAWLREAGADLQDIQEAMGHEDITTTTIYAHLATSKRLARLTELLGKVMPGATGTSHAGQAPPPPTPAPSVPAWMLEPLQTSTVTDDAPGERPPHPFADPAVRAKLREMREMRRRQRR